MVLSTLTDLLGRRHGDEQAIRLLAEAGFDAFDLSLFRMSSQKDYEMNRPSFREYAARLREVADECGIPCNQAHAPFPSNTGIPAEDEEIFLSLVRSLEAAAILGAKSIVVHPLTHLSHAVHAQELKELNMAFYRRLIPYCEQFGIQVACENMFDYSEKARRIVPSVCALPAEFCDYLDTLNSPWIVACLDVGHVGLTNQDLPFFVRALGSKRLRALHVHDNDFVNDIHTLPLTMNIDFAPFTAALAEIGYEGDFTFEADTFLEKLPLELEQEGLRFMEKVGRYLVAQIEAHNTSVPV